MTAALKLGRPDCWGHHPLADGSIVYASGGEAVAVRPGEFFCWLRVGERLDKQGRRVPDGEVIFDGAGIAYYPTAGEALARLNQERRRRGLV